MTDRPQSFEHHAAWVPGHHFVTWPLVAAAVVWGAWSLARDFSVPVLMYLVLALAVALVNFYARAFPLGVQDRVIRLEERLRLAELLPGDLKGRIDELTTEQLIGLRFASDGELPELARRVLDEGMTDRKSIKAAVKSWRADHQRI